MSLSLSHKSHRQCHAICRKIAGLERLVLNADQAWRPGGVSRSVDLDDLGACGTPPLQPPSPSTAAAHRAAITQSMPAFNRATLRQAMQRPRRQGVPAASPLAADTRPGTAVANAQRAPLYNPRSPGSLQLHDCFIAPEVRSRIQPSAPGSAGGSHRSNARPKVEQEMYMDGDDLVEQGSLSTCSVSVSRPAAAVEMLNQEARNDRYAGPAGDESDQMRVARLELQLQTVLVRAYHGCPIGGFQRR